MTDPLVSVKMLTYNHNPYIIQAIEGVINQKTNFPFELVIGEDCSTDGTREIVFDFANRYPDIIRVITSDQNVGMRKNGARTIKACRGTYIAFCEGDDYWNRSDKLQLQIDYLEAHSECGLVCSDYDYAVIKTGKVINHYRRHLKRISTNSPKIDDILMGRAGILTCTVVARRNLINQIVESDTHLFGSGTFMMGDTQLWAELSLISAIHCIDESLATYQLLDESATRSKDRRKKLRFWLSNAEMCLYLCDKHRLPSPIREFHEKSWCRKSLQLAFLEKRRDLAELVKQKSPSLSVKEWVWYLGTTTPILRPIVSLFILFFQREA